MALIRKRITLLIIVLLALNLVGCDDDIETLFTLLYIFAISVGALALIFIFLCILLVWFLIRWVVRMEARFFRRRKEKRKLMREKEKYTKALEMFKWDVLQHSVSNDSREMIEKYLADIDAQIAEFDKRKV